jgi:hypothetical protein
MKKKSKKVVDIPTIEVRKSYKNSVEEKFPSIYESRKDLSYDRPDPLKVEVKPELKAYWAKDTPNSIQQLKYMGYITADERHFKEGVEPIETFGDLRLMVCLKEDYEKRQRRQQEMTKRQIESLSSKAEREGITMEDRSGKIKGYVSGHSFN